VTEKVTALQLPHDSKSTTRDTSCFQVCACVHKYRCVPPCTSSSLWQPLNTYVIYIKQIFPYSAALLEFQFATKFVSKPGPECSIRKLSHAQEFITHAYVHMHIHPYIFCSVRTLVCGEHYTFLSFFPGLSYITNMHVDSDNSISFSGCFKFKFSHTPTWVELKLSGVTEIIHSLQQLYTHYNNYTLITTIIHSLQQLYTHYNCHVQKASREKRRAKSVASTRVYCVLVMGWLRIVGLTKLQGSFAKKPHKRDYILQKRLIIESILLTVAIPYKYTCTYRYPSVNSALYRDDLASQICGEQCSLKSTTAEFEKHCVYTSPFYVYTHVRLTEEIDLYI